MNDFRDVGLVGRETDERRPHHPPDSPVARRDTDLRKPTSHKSHASCALHPLQRDHDAFVLQTLHIMVLNDVSPHFRFESLLRKVALLLFSGE